MTMGREPFSGEEPIDIVRLTTQCGGDRAFVLEVLQIFREQGTQHMAALRKAVESKNAKEIELVAHRISGSAGNMAAMKLSELAWDLERSAAVGEVIRADNSASQIEAEFERCLTFFTTIQARLK